MYEPYTKSIFYSVPKEKLVFRKYLQNEQNGIIQDELLPISSLHNGGATNLEVDSYSSLLCWIQSSNHRLVVCSDLNGENSTVKFTTESKAERVVGFAIDSIDHALFVMVAVSLSNVYNT